MARVAESRRPLHWLIRDVLPPSGRRAARRTTDRATASILGSLRSASDAGTATSLTFDDGPVADTDRLLDSLASRGATATFFVLVNAAETFPHHVRRMVADGHEVGLHGIDHRRMTNVARKDVLHSLVDGRRRLEAITGSRVRWYRPPFGAQTIGTYTAARRAGMEVVVWSRDLADWVEQTPADIGRSARDIVAGDIVLLHEVLACEPGAQPPHTSFDRLAAADAALDAVIESGLRPMSVGKLIELGKPCRTTWLRP